MHRIKVIRDRYQEDLLHSQVEPFETFLAALSSQVIKPETGETPYGAIKDLVLRILSQAFGPLPRPPSVDEPTTTDAEVLGSVFEDRPESGTGSSSKSIQDAQERRENLAETIITEFAELYVPSL
jgi:hypothetical protein